jgi:phosphoketolase
MIPPQRIGCPILGWPSDRLGHRKPGIFGGACVTAECLTYRRTNHGNMHVRGYEEKGNINTSMELAVNNEVDRFTVAVEAIDRTRKLQGIGVHAKRKYRDQ